MPLKWADTLDSGYQTWQATDREGANLIISYIADPTYRRQGFRFQLTRFIDDPEAKKEIDTDIKILKCTVVFVTKDLDRAKSKAEEMFGK